MKLLLDTNVVQDHLITRNVKDFEEHLIPSMTPSDFWSDIIKEKFQE